MYSGGNKRRNFTFKRRAEPEIMGNSSAARKLPPDNETGSRSHEAGRATDQADETTAKSWPERNRKPPVYIAYKTYSLTSLKNEAVHF